MHYQILLSHLSTTPTRIFINNFKIQINKKINLYLIHKYNLQIISNNKSKFRNNNKLISIIIFPIKHKI